MSGQALEWAGSFELGPPYQGVLAYLADNCDNDGEGNGQLPPMSKLKEALGRDADRVIEWLHVVGLITVWPGGRVRLHLHRRPSDLPLASLRLSDTTPAFTTGGTGSKVALYLDASEARYLLAFVLRDGEHPDLEVILGQIAYGDHR
jgi:hypothetical protein